MKRRVRQILHGMNREEKPYTLGELTELVGALDRRIKFIRQARGSDIDPLVVDAAEEILSEGDPVCARYVRKVADNWWLEDHDVNLWGYSKGLNSRVSTVGTSDQQFYFVGDPPITPEERIRAVLDHESLQAEIVLAKDIRALTAPNHPQLCDYQIPPAQFGRLMTRVFNDRFERIETAMYRRKDL